MSQPDPALRAPRRDMHPGARFGLIATGAASWVGGAVATFTGGEGSSAAALIAAGVLTGLLGMVGRWPSRISFSGSEISWPELNEAVNEQIQAAQDSGNEGAVSELEDLRRRLAELQRTGTAPQHPAAVYDDAVEKALSRALPAATLTKSSGRSREQADFEVVMGSQRILVESKFKYDPRRPFQGSTLNPLLDQLDDDQPLLIVTNSLLPRGAQDVVKDRPQPVRVVTWLSSQDDVHLQQALRELLKANP